MHIALYMKHNVDAYPQFYIAECVTKVHLINKRFIKTTVLQIPGVCGYFLMHSLSDYSIEVFGSLKSKVIKTKKKTCFIH